MSATLEAARLDYTAARLIEEGAYRYLNQVPGRLSDPVLVRAAECATAARMAAEEQIRSLTGRSFR